MCTYILKPWLARLDYQILLYGDADDLELWQGIVEVLISCYVNLMKAIGELVQDANVTGVRPRAAGEGEYVRHVLG